MTRPERKRRTAPANPAVSMLAAAAAVALTLAAAAAAGTGGGPAEPEAVVLTSSNLPILVIDTGGRPVPMAPKMNVSLRVVDHGGGLRNGVNDPADGYDGTIGIEFRGSSALNFPKPPYGFETRDASGANLDTSLLGLPEENDWVMYNPYSDKTLMRNVLAFRMSNAIGRYATRTRFCELVLNGDYRGVYVLMEKIKRDRNRVAVAECDSADTAGVGLTGGYIVKVDKGSGENVAGWSSARRVSYQYHYPKPNEIHPRQKDYIKAFMNAFEAEMEGPSPASSALIDLDAFVDHFILGEATRNVDAYRLSAFLYKDRDDRDGRLKAGPTWDCDLAFGNVNYHEAHRVDGWNLDALVASPEGNGVPFWWMRLRNDPVFWNRFCERWAAFRSGPLATDSLLQFMDAAEDTLAEAQARNFRRWPVIGSYVWPNAFIGASFDEEVEFLREWLANRLAWMDANARPGTSGVAEPGGPAFPGTARLHPNYPNPFNASTVIPFETGSAGRVKVTVFDPLGRAVRTLVDAEWTAGRSAVTWDGSDDRGRPAASGLYLVRIETGRAAASRKIALLR